MFRRSFLKSLAATTATALVCRRRLEAALPKAKITRVNIYEPPNVNRLFNQSNMLVTVETDIGITGIGEGGGRDTLEQCAGNLIGQNPFQIERLWREMYDSWFYPPGREKIHALGAMDLALWDIKGKAFNAPIHQILGGSQRDFCECYATGNVRPAAASGAARGAGQTAAEAAARIRETAAATIAYGYKVYRMDAGGITPVVNNVYNARERVRLVAEACKAVISVVGRTEVCRVNRVAYDRFYEVYRALYPQLREQFARIGQLVA